MPIEAAPTALIAEDEPLLARALQQELAAVWPALRVVATVGDGASAHAQALALRPDVLFFDIRMPGMGGLEAATALAEDWPMGQPFPQLVFVTAYDQYALDAFEAQAVDYLLKPVQPERLLRTVLRVQERLKERPQERNFESNVPDAGVDRSSIAINLEARLAATLTQLQALLPQASRPSQTASAHTTPQRLTAIQASVGQQIHLVPIADVIYIEAADKYLRVLTAEREYLIRTPLKELLPQLDAQAFWQIHRGTVVQAAAIASVQREADGKLKLSLRGRSEALAVSRLYAHLFRAM